MTNIIGIFDCILDCEMQGIDTSNLLVALDCAVEAYTRESYRTYTIHSLQSYRPTGKCESVWNGKTYTL